MKTKREFLMHSATNMGLARLFCRKCEEETLHKHSVCIHCGTLRTSVEQRDEGSWRAKSARERINATQRERMRKSRAKRKFVQDAVKS